MREIDLRSRSCARWLLDVFTFHGPVRRIGEQSSIETGSKGQNYS